MPLHSLEAGVEFRRAFLLGFVFNGQLERSISHECRRLLRRFRFGA
jgi:hypothetical protein